MELHSDSGGPGLRFARVMEGFFLGQFGASIWFHWVIFDIEFQRQELVLVLQILVILLWL